MAARYWVGGSGTWNTTSTTNWSTSSGGASGASVPTAADSVFFDQAGTYTVTCTGALTCLDITVSAGTVTFAQGTLPTFTISGSMSLIAGTVWSSTGAITFLATTTGKTVTTNGTSLSGSIVFNGASGGWTLGSALTTTNTLTVIAGAFDTANYAITTTQFSGSSGSTRTITFGSSTITTTSAGGINFTNTASLTFNAGTSNIVCTAAGTGVVTGISSSLTFYNLSFTSTTAGTNAITQGGIGAVGTVTFNNISVAAPAAAGVTTLTFEPRIVVNGTLSTTGTAGNRRVFFASATYGLSVDLVVNSAPSLTDADFRGLYVRGTAAPISGTRIGNRGECRGITFSTPKTVYWNLAGAQNWSANGWAATSTGAPSTDYFPLPQDTATFTNAGSVTGIISIDVPALSSVDMSGRTSAMTLGLATATVYGNWTNGSGTTLTNAVTLTFSGGGTQTITSAGKAFTCPITINTYGGTVQLADALNIGTNTLTVTNGTFNTQGYAVTAFIFSSNNSNVRQILLGASTITLTSSSSAISINSTNSVFNAGTSQINLSSTLGVVITAGNVIFYNVSFTGAPVATNSIIGANTFNNLTFTAPASAGLTQATFSANQTINGTLTCAGASAVRRIFLQSNTIGTQRTLTANAISATDCDFRDITIAGTASGSSPTRAGDCGGNAGITFPSPKTVYWNLAGVQNWSATGWATSSGGSPAVNNFPLAQDTAVFDNTGSVTGTITIDAAWNIGTFDASGRTSAMTLTTSTNTPTIYGDWKFGTGVTSSSTTGTITFSKNGTSTITSNGVQFGCPVTVNHPSGTVQLADALSLGATRTLTLTAGTFDAVTYNVTTGLFVNSSGTTLKMGAGTWTLSGVGTLWNVSPANIFFGTSTVVLSDTSTSARTLNGGGYLNKVTIGGTTGTSTLNINSALTIGELASTKTVAHTITFQSSLTATVGKWSVTGTLGNVVTVNASTAGTAFILSIAGPANSGIDYLSVRDCAVDTASPGEFYVGANSTNVSNNTRVIFTATPSPRTLYWVGGTGNWSSTTKWSTSSGGASGAAIPTSLDAVNFDSLSNATAYTATIDAGVTVARCASFTMAGPLTGNVTFAGTVAIAFHGNVSFAATGITRTYTGTMYCAGNSSYTFTTNGLALASILYLKGIGATWSLGSALTSSQYVDTEFGTFSTSASNYACSLTSLYSSYISVRSILLNASTYTCNSNTPVTFTTATNLTFNAGTSLISSPAAATFAGGGLTFYNVSFGVPANTTTTITGANTFNTLSFSSQTTVGIQTVTFSANQTIGTLTLNAGTAAAYRQFLTSDTIGTQRTLAVTTLTAGAADYDFRDIAITGAAAPLTGTRFGDCKGNSGITFDAAKTVYRAAATASWGAAAGASGWALTNGGSVSDAAFPLAQDNAIFPSTPTPYPSSGSTVTINANYNVGTIDMSARTANTMTLATSTNTPAIYGNWINGTGTTLTGTGAMTFAGRGSQTITSAGKTFTQQFVINTLGGSVTLQDAFVSGTTSLYAFSHTAGTLDANGYNVTQTSSASFGAISSTGSNTRTIAIGSGTWTTAATTGWNITGSSVTVTGTGTISLTSASAKTFAGNSLSYSGITLNQGGAGALTITGNNTFKDITNTYSATGAATISLGSTTQTLTQFTGTGAAAKLLTLSGTSAASPATLILTSGVVSTPDYLSISNVRAYSLSSTWYAGANSTNLGSLGWIFASAGGVIYNVTITETGTGTDAITAKVTLLGSIGETGTGTDTTRGGLRYLGSITETGTGTDSIAAKFTPRASITETATGSDVESAILAAISRINETATGSDTESAKLTAKSNIAETATGTDTDSARMTARSSISELATITDLPSAKVQFLTAIAESATASDLISSIKGLFAYIVESASITDTLTAPGSTYNPRTVETATATDSITALARFASQVVESATISDLISATKTLLSAILESAVVTDTPSAKATFRSQVAETAVAQDIVRGFMVAAVAITETATGTDQISALRRLAAAVVEAATGTDAVTAKAIFRGILQEIATLTDAVTAPGSTYRAPVVELATLQDAVRAAAVFPVSFVDSATGTQTNSATFVPLSRIVETATGTDAEAAKAVFRSVLSELATAADLFRVAPSTFNAPVVELATITDALTAPGSIYNPRLVETVTISDFVIGGYLWNLIDDSQIPAWGNINDQQTVVWAQVNDTQAPNWQNVSNSQASGWTQIDDTQAPDWQDIQT